MNVRVASTEALAKMRNFSMRTAFVNLLASVILSLALVGCGNPTREFQDRLKSIDPHFTAHDIDGRALNYTVAFGKYDVRKNDSTISPYVADLFVAVNC